MNASRFLHGPGHREKQVAGPAVLTGHRVPRRWCQVLTPDRLLNATPKSGVNAVALSADQTAGVASGWSQFRRIRPQQGIFGSLYCNLGTTLGEPVAPGTEDFRRP